MSSIATFIAFPGHTFLHERPSLAKTLTGGAAPVFSTIAAALVGWIQPIDAFTFEQYGKRDLIVSHRIYFGADPEAIEGDRMSRKGRFYVVMGLENQAGLDELWRLNVRET